MSWRARKVGLSQKAAVAHIEKHGALLVYPIKNKDKPNSLWSCFYPATPMRWDWDETGDDRVVGMWDLREVLSRTDKVVYVKWFQNRATFFSREVFVALLATLNEGRPQDPQLTVAGPLFELIHENSPQSTKVLRQRAKKELGWDNKLYEKAFKELWQKCLVVGRGEVDDGAFPSLNVCAVEHAFEELWIKAKQGESAQFRKVLEKYFPSQSAWERQLHRLESKTLKKEESPKAKKKGASSSEELTFEQLTGYKGV